MKIALVHDWLHDWAGSERVVEQILQCYPSADLFSLVDFLAPEHRARLMGKQAHTTFLQNMPFARTRLPLYLPWMPFAIEQLDLSAYDLVISSSHAVAKGVITSPDQCHIAYVHSPMRYAWDLQHDYLRDSAGKGISGFALRWILHYLRLWDSRTANAVDAYAANSQFVARRIRKIYRREAHVIHPPVDIDRFSLVAAKEDFYICASRLMPYKRVDLIVDAFKELPQQRLIVIGEGPQRRSLSKHAGANVSFLGYQPDAVVQSHLQRAKALIFAAKEDFGIVPVEAQACGTPVIGYGAGGLLETVAALDTPEPTGVLFAEQTSAAIADAIRTFEATRRKFDPVSCHKNAQRFSVASFQRKFRAFVEQALTEHSASR
jgi:glycosyltransferase involved in cell wall biosynthesis